ncbi:MAG: GNAT family N-acetyltransferase [Flavobacteriales bacterium]|nr:GNAT family N-acetyltransferase [Flavobacteriales bacterium]
MKYELLVGNKVKLREMQDDDLELIFDWENRPELDYLGSEHQPLTEDQISNFINHSTGDIYTDGQLRLMIDCGDTTVGCIDLFEFDPYNQRAGVGILIAETKDRKNGYAKEALNLLRNYCFEVMNFRQLYCHVPVDNEASLNLFSSCGFEKSGTNRDWVKKGNLFFDAVFMQKVNG